MVKDSEYQRQFRSRWEKHAPVYDDNVEYRYVRRSVEHNHHTGAFTWDEKDWWESDSVFSAGARPRSGVPLHRYKHQKFNQAYEDRVIEHYRAKGYKKEKSTGQTTPTTPEHEQQIRVKKSNAKSPEKISHEPVQKPGSRNAMVQVNGFMTPSTPSTPSEEESTPSLVNHATQTNNRKTDVPPNKARSTQNKVNAKEAKPADSRLSRPQKPAVKPKFSTLGPKQTRPRSAPPSRTRKSLPEQPKPPPFLAFGYRDKERTIGSKKTHNIRASAEVYPAALRAQKRMELAIQLMEEEAKNSSNFEKRRRALFNDKPKAESWDTEYRRNYVGYGDEEYERILSARLHPLKHQNAYFIPA